MDKTPVTTLELYDLEADVSEKYNIASQHSETVKELFDFAEVMWQDIGDGGRKGKNSRFNAQKLKEVELMRRNKR